MIKGLNKPSSSSSSSLLLNFGLRIVLTMRGEEEEVKVKVCLDPGSGDENVEEVIWWDEEEEEVEDTRGMRLKREIYSMSCRVLF